MKNCLICKTSYEVSNFKYYCSHECFLKSNRSGKSTVLPCEHCGKLVLKYKSQLISKIFCNKKCAHDFGKILLKCGNCGSQFTVKKSKTYTRGFKIPKINFCSRHCKGTYDSINATGIFNPNSSYIKRRSLLELFIEEKIKLHFPYIDLILNNRSLLESKLEVDFYFPDLKLAIEVNGIVHYKAIYGEDAFTKIQEKDNRKIQLCGEKKIDLIIIKSVVRFYESVGEKIWNEEIKPELLKRIPFCKNKMSITLTPKINPIKQLFQNRKK